MQSRLDEVAENSVLTQLLAGFQAMQAFHQHEALAVAADQDRGLRPTCNMLAAISCAFRGSSDARRFAGT